MKKDQTPLNLILRCMNHFLVFVIVIGLLTSCESRRIIVNGLEEKDANEILVFLSTKGVNAQKVRTDVDPGAGGGGIVLWNISVSEEQATEAMALLNQAGLPRRRGQSLLGIFATTGLVPSGLQEKIRYQAGLGEQIASIIRKIDGVLDADIQISFPEEDPLNPGAPKQKITASVYVKHNGVLDDPNAHLVTRIKRLVAGGVPGLDYDSVTVIGDRVRFGDWASALQGAGEEEKTYVNVWSIVLAKESLNRFRIIFFSFIITILLLTLFLLWLLWKFFPVLRQTGGIKQLFSPHQIKQAASAPAEAALEEQAKEATTGEEEGTAGKGIDET
jgi:type III secretion protein J